MLGNSRTADAFTGLLPAMLVWASLVFLSVDFLGFVVRNTNICIASAKAVSCNHTELGRRTGRKWNSLYSDLIMVAYAWTIAPTLSPPTQLCNSSILYSVFLLEGGRDCRCNTLIILPVRSTVHSWDRCRCRHLPIVTLNAVVFWAGPLHVIFHVAGIRLDLLWFEPTNFAWKSSALPLGYSKTISHNKQ